MTNETQLGRLKSEILRCQAVFVVGSGVSRATCKDQTVDGHMVASWQGLLKHGVETCRDQSLMLPAHAKLYLRLMAGGDADQMIEVAEAIVRSLSRHSQGMYRGWLKNTVGMLEVRERSLVDALASLPGVLATLNYDHLIEGATGRRFVTWKQADAVEDVLRMRKNHILHLHGEFEDPDSVVLSLKSYLRATADQHAVAVLRTMAIERVMVFVGCADTLLDPNFSELLEWSQNALRDVEPRHYLLCRTSQLQAYKRRFISAKCLQLVPYGDKHEDLVAFLRALGHSAAGNPAAVDAARPLPQLFGVNMRQWSPVYGTAALLRPDVDARVPFHFREAELQSVSEWCGGPDFGVRLYTGPGGAGKTRLFMEAASRRLAEGWIAGFIPNEAALTAVEPAEGAKVFLVVDYAEHSPKLAAQVLQRALEWSRRCRVRVVLAGRSKLGWWDRVRRLGSLRDVLHGPNVDDRQTVGPMAMRHNDRAESYQIANTHFASVLGRPPVEEIPQLDSAVYESILLVHLRALLGPGLRGAGSDSGVWEVLLDREINQLERQLEDRQIHASLMPVLPRVLSHLVYTGGATESALKDFLGSLELLADQPSAVISAIAEVFRGQYPSPEPSLWVAPVRPDAFGEFILGTHGGL